MSDSPLSGTFDPLSTKRPARQTTMQRKLRVEPLENKLCLSMLGFESLSPVTTPSDEAKFAPTTQDLGIVDYIEFRGLDPSDGDQVYRCQTTRAGFVSVSADYNPNEGDLVLVLSDVNGNILDSSSKASGHQRVDAIAAASGEEFLIRLEGSNSNVKFRIGNLVSQVGTDIMVQGSDADDSFLFFPLGNEYSIEINGFDYLFEDVEVDTVTFDGGLGQDWASVEVVNPGDSLRMSPFAARIAGANYSTSIFNTPRIIAFGGGEEFGCRAFLYDSDGDDQFVGSHRATKLHGTTSSGMTYSNRAEGFRDVHAYARKGGFDEAIFTDSTGKDKFKINAKSHWALMRGSGHRYHLRAKFFDKVTANSVNGGDDQVQFVDSAGNDLFEVKPRDWAVLSTLNESYWAKNFDNVIVKANSGGFDQALFHDTIAKDRFIGRPGKAWMFDVAPSHEYDVIARSFEEVIVNATFANGDVARLMDSAKADTFVARQDTCRLSGDHYSITINDFANVRVTSSYPDSSQNDYAILYDTALDDLFEASGSSAKLSVDDGQGGWDTLYEVVAFDRIRAVGTAGGTNTRIVAPVSFDIQWEGIWL